MLSPPIDDHKEPPQPAKRTAVRNGVFLRLIVNNRPHSVKPFHRPAPRGQRRGGRIVPSKRMKERYFPVAQKINRDPEVRQLKHELGITGFSMWLQILAETDGQKGLWKGSARDIAGVLSGTCESNSRGAIRLLLWATVRGWIRWQRGSGLPLEYLAEGVNSTSQRGSAMPLDCTVEGVNNLLQRGSAIDSWGGLIIAKFAKYHVSQEEEKNDENSPLLNLPSEPSEPSEPDRIKNQPDPQIKQWADQIYAIDPKRYDRLVAWIKGNERRDPAVVAGTLEKFLPYARDPNIRWWAYLDKILDKESAKYNARITQDESEKYKRELKEIAESLRRGSRSHS